MTPFWMKMKTILGKEQLMRKSLNFEMIIECYLALFKTDSMVEFQV
jgi:hypothetical protein